MSRSAASDATIAPSKYWRFTASNGFAGSATLTIFWLPKSTGAPAAPNPLNGMFALSSFVLVMLASSILVVVIASFAISSSKIVPFKISSVVTAPVAISKAVIPPSETSSVNGTASLPLPFNSNVASDGPTTSFPTILSFSVIPNTDSFTKVHWLPFHWKMSPGCPPVASANLPMVTDLGAKSPVVMDVGWIFESAFIDWVTILAPVICPTS